MENQVLSQAEKIIPTVSVLLPCRNGAATLEVALRSMFNQSFSDFELLLINDGSTDDTVALAQSFGDERLSIVGDERALGLPKRLNQGVQMARGRYIARMDADDVAFPTRLAEQVAFLEAHSAIDLVACRAVVFRNDGDIVGLLPFAQDHARLCAYPWRNIPLPHPGWMGRRTWFERFPYRIPEVRRAEDQELLLRAYPDSQYACLDRVLLGYRQGDFQLKRTLVARWALLAAQLGLFIERREWEHVLRALLLSFFKVGVDCLAALPGCERLFFLRMNEPVPKEVRDILQDCLVPGSGES